jgi:hypothetical protein
MAYFFNSERQLVFQYMNNGTIRFQCVGPRVIYSRPSLFGCSLNPTVPMGHLALQDSPIAIRSMIPPAC